MELPAAHDPRAHLPAVGAPRFSLSVEAEQPAGEQYRRGPDTGRRKNWNKARCPRRALLLGGSNNNAIAPAIYKNLDFDPAKDFAPVAALATESLVLVVHLSVPAATLTELVRYAKENSR
jgi:hypothetical protein